MAVEKEHGKEKTRSKGKRGREMGRDLYPETNEDYLCVLQQLPWPWLAQASVLICQASYFPTRSTTLPTHRASGIFRNAESCQNVICVKSDADFFS